MNPSTVPFSRKDAPAFDFYPERWAHGTRHLTKEERCDFLDLLAIQWTDDGIIDDLPRIARMLGYRKVNEIPLLVLEKFPVAADGRRRHPFLEKLRADQRTRIDSRRRGAEQTNRKRWGFESAATRDAVEGANAETALTAVTTRRVDEAHGTNRSPRTHRTYAGENTHSQPAQPSLSDPPATSERIATESPPLTAHHPPRINLCSSSGSNPALAREPALAGPSAPPGHGDPFPTLPEVQAHGLTIGATPDCCEAFWQECEAVRWVNKHGVPIADWRPLLARFRTRWNAIAAERLQHASTSFSSSNSSRKLPSSPPLSRHAYGNPRSNPASASGELNRPGRYATPSKVAAVH